MRRAFSRLAMVGLAGFATSSALIMDDHGWNAVIDQLQGWGEQAKERAIENRVQWIGSAISSIVVGIIWVSILYMRGKSTPEILEKLIPAKKEQNENPVVERAKARALFDQLSQDLVVLEGRKRWLPEQLKDIRTQLANARKELEERQSALKIAQISVEQFETLLTELLKENDGIEDDIDSINDELERLRKLI